MKAPDGVKISEHMPTDGPYLYQVALEPGEDGQVACLGRVRWITQNPFGGEHSHEAWVDLEELELDKDRSQEQLERRPAPDAELLALQALQDIRTLCRAKRPSVLLIQTVAQHAIDLAYEMGWDFE